MALTWTYSAWREQATDALRLTMLRQHMTEVADAIAAANSKSADSYSKSEDRGSLVTYLAQLEASEAKLAEKVSAASTSRIVLTRIRRPR